MKKTILFIVLLLFFKLGFSQELNKKDLENVKILVDCIKSNNIEKLKTLIVYPLKRTTPLLDIKNEFDFKKRYHEIFDDGLKSLIISSNIKTDWSSVGSKGIMFNIGELWLNSNGKLIAVNYKSDFEYNKKNELIERKKKSIHESLKSFKEPILVIKTKKFKIRIDLLEDFTYRYASWSIDSEMSEPPNLIVKNGTLIPDGNGGNHRYEFINGSYRYTCIVNVIGVNDTPSAELVVFQNDKVILKQAGQIIKK